MKKTIFIVVGLVLLGTIMTTVFCFVVNKQMPGAGVAKRFFIFTLTGTDGVAQLVYPTFYLIGEWFMTCIVVCYLLFPVLAWLLKKHPKITAIAFLLWYIYILMVNPFSITPLMNPLLIIFYFYAGMELYQKKGTDSFKYGVRGLSAIFAALCFGYFIAIGYNPSLEYLKMSQENTEIIYLALSLFLFIALRDVQLNEDGIMYRAITYLSGISWFIILMHHRIMILIYSHVDVNSLNHGQIWMLLLACIALTWLASELVRFLSNKIKSLLFNSKR